MNKTAKPKPALLERRSFSISRAAEYFDVSELEKLTGQPRRHFATVVLKELVDNALDAAETAGRTPQIEIEVNRTEGFLTLAVSDNGHGLNLEQIDRLLDFRHPHVGQSRLQHADSGRTGQRTEDDSRSAVCPRR